MYKISDHKSINTIQIYSHSMKCDKINSKVVLPSEHTCLYFVFIYCKQLQPIFLIICLWLFLIHHYISQFFRQLIV